MMPGFVPRKSGQFPNKAQRAGVLRLALRPKHALLALAVTFMGLTQAPQVWAIGERLSMDPIGREALKRAQRAESGLLINARMAADPTQQVEIVSERHIPKVTGTTKGSLRDLRPLEGLSSDHHSFALIKAGDMRFADGAITTAWTSFGSEEENSEAEPQAKTGMGRSVAMPSDRTPPSDLWKRLNGAERDRHGRNGERSWQFVPASLLPTFTATSEASARKKDVKPASSFTSARFGRPITTAAVLFDTPDAALDARACRELDRIAADLRTTIYPVELRSYRVNEAGGTMSSAVSRALNVRAYLVARGVPMEQIRILRADTPSMPAHDQGPFRVDVIYTTG